ncbi:hypothetical protein C6497_09040 [Candidatus Poribacteria bacterium]|nr:MAG: hypothetical protein C6497_09040 [Candidatus Poribacteria bacterium]
MTINGRTRFIFCMIGMLFILGFLYITVQEVNAREDLDMEKDRIQIYKENPRYWQYKGEPILLIGGTVEDNLFQIQNLREHLELLKSVGGNYVRSTMGWNDEGNIPPFKKVGEKYDLNQWDEDFWNRFRNFIKWTHELDIIVQIEVWATFTYYRESWLANPYNPNNNTNYTEEESGLPTVVNSHPVATKNNFFWSVPKERNQKTVLKYQEKYVDKLLEETLPYGHILYCMDNETAVTVSWGEYWATYIQKKAAEEGRYVETTEMWDPWDLSDEKHKATFDHPETYSFCDISQNNHQKRQRHWDNAQKIRANLNPIRPINNIKIYGADGGRFGSTRDGLERFWRNIFGGFASARFHRPDSGVGLSEIAQAHLKSMRMITDEMDVFTCEPQNQLLSNREDNEAYVIANPGKEYAVYFPKGGSVDLNLNVKDEKDAKTVRLRWININKSEWKLEKKMSFKDSITLTQPTDSHWAVLVQIE